MNFATIALENRTTTLVLTVVMLFMGLSSYQGLGRLEDPEFTIKDALVVTPYPGATAEEVELEVTDEIEMAVQKLGQLDEIESRSIPGLSTVTVSIQDRYDQATLPQVWDELRRKVGDAQRSLPPGAGPSIVVDDYGDVYGVFVAIYGEGFSAAELEDYGELLRRELLLVDDVAKVELFGVRPEVIYVELDRDRMSQLGVPPSFLIGELNERNLVESAGRVRVGPDLIPLRPTGLFQSIEDIEKLRLRPPGSDRQFLLRDVARVRRGYAEPRGDMLRFDGAAAIGLGVSTAPGGNVVTMGEALNSRVQELMAQTPLGLEFGVIAL